MQWSAVLGVGLLTVVAWAGPVTLTPDQVDFGTRGQQLHLEAVVTITNTTAGEIHLLNVSSDCSCTAGEPQQQKLGPGASTTMPVGMDTRAYLGPVERRLIVHTSAGDAELRVKATIRPFEDWDVTPMPLILPPSLRNQETSKTMIVAYTGNGKGDVLGATTDQPWLQASFAADVSGRGGQVALRKLASAPAGPNTAQLVLTTSDPTQPRLAISVYVPVLSEVRVTPNPLILPTTKLGSTVVREIVVSGWEAGGEPLARIAAGTVTTRGRQPNGDYIFAVSVTPSVAGMNTQKLQLALDETNILIEVPVILKVEP